MTVKEYDQIEGEIEKLLWSGKKSDKLVMFIIRHLFCAITCNKLIISVTLALNYIPESKREKNETEALLQIEFAEFLWHRNCENGP